MNCSKTVESLPIEPIQLIVISIKSMSIICCRSPSSLLSRGELATLVKEVVVAWQIGSSAQREDQLLVLLVLLLCQVILHKQVSELLLEQVIALNLATKVLS